MNEQDTVAYVTRVLDRGTRELDAATLTRLSAMRHNAVGRAALPERPLAGILTRALRPAWIAAFAVFFVLLAGWQYQRQQEFARAVETDLQILTGELPPTVYADHVFAPWLQGYRR